MKADTCLILNTRLHQEQRVIVDKIVTDNDISMTAVVCHSYAKKEMRKDLFPTFVWPRTKENQKKKDTDQLDLEIPQPGWLADPTHKTKVIGKQFFELLYKGKKHSNITKADFLSAKKYY
eukprot:2875256-Ditylum_brightwellii.AAC.1